MTSPEIHFVISAPRSGSTWLAQALNQHPDVFATEQRLFGNFCELWPNNNGSFTPRITFDAYARAVGVHYFHAELAESRNEFVEKFIQEYCRFLINLGAKCTGKKIIVDKITPYPGTTKYVLEQIKHYFPRAKIVKLVRDGRDVVTSATFDWLLKDGHGTDRFKFFVEQDSAVQLQRFFDDQTIKKWAMNWCETIREVRPSDLEVRFEQMLDDQPKILVQLFELLGVPCSLDDASRWADAVTFEKMTGRQLGQMDPTAKRRCGIWGDWKTYFTREDGKCFHAVAGNELLTTGYIQSADWFEQLPHRLSIRRDSVSPKARQG